MAQRLAWTLVVWVGVLVVGAGATKHYIKHELSTFVNDRSTGYYYELPWEAVYSNDNELGSKSAELTFRLTLLRSSADAKGRGRVTVVVCPKMDVYDFFGYMANGNVVYCCGNTKAFSCEDGGPALPIAHPGEIIVHEIDLHAGQEEARSDWSMWHSRSEVLSVFVLACDKNVGSAVDLDGSIEFRSTYGYVPGRAYGMFPFYGAMILAYLFTAIFWTFLCIKYRKNLLRLQYMVSIMLAMGLLELVVGWLEMLLWNTWGYDPMVLSALRILASLAKRAFSRMAILAMANGFGVVRPTLGSIKYKILALGAAFLLVASVEEIVDQLTLHQDFPMMWKLAVIIPFSFIDAIFYVWTFSSLRTTIQKLRIRQQSSKLGMYQKWMFIFGTALVLGALFMVYHIFMDARFETFEMWKILWIFKAFWIVFHMVLLVAIAAVWRPSTENVRFAYSAEINIDDDTQVREPASVPMIVEDRTASLRNVARTQSGAGDVEAHRDSAAESAAAAPAPSTAEPPRPKMVASFTIDADEEEEERQELSKLE